MNTAGTGEAITCPNCHNNNPMKPTAEQIAEAAKRGIVPGAVCRSPYGVQWPLGKIEQWRAYPSGDIYDLSFDSGPFLVCQGDWATVITPAPSAGGEWNVDHTPMEARIAAAEASLQRLDDAIAELRAMVEKPVEPWTPKFGDRVITPNGEGIYWYVHRNGVHTVIFAEGDQRYYNTSQLSTIKP